MPFSKNYHKYDADGRYVGFTGTTSTPDVSGTKVSVIIPIYNVEAYLDQAIQSVRDQSHENLEIICVNDGSTDGSLDIVKKHAAEDPRIVVIDKENEGYGASCNRGLDAATGEWISIVEPDDWIEGDMYGEMLEFAAGIDGEFDIIKTPYYLVVNHDHPKRQRSIGCSYILLVHPEVQPFHVEEHPELISHHPSIWSAIYRKSFLDEKGIRFKPIPGAGWADNPFLMETMLQARGIVYLEKPFYSYRADLPGKEKAFAQKSPNVPFDRWDEMCDIIERLGVTDERILNAHINRGIMYMSGIIQHNDVDSSEIQALLRRMFERMDPDLLFANDRVSPGSKKLYAKVMGIEAPRIDPRGYMGNLVGKAMYQLRNDGPLSMATAVMHYLVEHPSRIGK